MDKATRAKLLRDRLTAVRGYALPPLDRRPRRPKRTPLPYVGSSRVIAVGQHLKEMPQKWIAEPDAVAPQLTPQTRRTARKSALTRIAEQLPAKLPRIAL